MSTPTITMTFDQHSTDPSSVVQVHRGHLDQYDALEPSEVLVAFLVSPVNPQDLAVIAGRYPVQPSFHHPPASGHAPIPGYDGAARVLGVGCNVKTDVVSPGDLVIPARHGIGTWRTHAKLPADALVRVPASLAPTAAAMLRMAFCPAYLLLEDHRDAAGRALRPGDWIVLNAAGGAIAGLLVQFARMRGCRTLGVVRDASVFLEQGGRGAAGRPDVVVSEAELAARGAEVDPRVKAAVQGGQFVLALDAVFGEAGERTAKLLAPGGVFVAYGFMGGTDSASIQLTPELLFWKHITFRNFRLSDAMAGRSKEEQRRLFEWFAQLVEDGTIIPPPVEEVVLGGKGASLEDTVKKALDKASGKAARRNKQVFVYDAM
ncbi:Alcohol dehydrogenase superfamily zinc-containing [Macrophomina phaseolina MS6]|uniref:enoyl-[acyl-carrier-protein] reductase n=1 Tax=Macrophomina phaseolina (strain MS6) TaxID=1126212 RepID=K2R226_MACPH|nr:Alcohol dehydrogenase superfamily zinc-containing [Macrophomina phaseolina MS6]